MYRMFLIVILLLFAATSLPAQHEVHSECKPFVEVNKKWQTLRIRPHENAFITCTISQGQFNKLIRESLEEADSDQVNFKSLFMGRLIDHPWISKYLAMQALASDDWNPETRELKDGDINSFVRHILESPELLQQIQEPFADTGYTVTGASVEKVLITKANEIPWLELSESVLVPYDAMIHYILQKPKVSDQ